MKMETEDQELSVIPQRLQTGLLHKISFLTVELHSVPIHRKFVSLGTQVAAQAMLPKM